MCKLLIRQLEEDGKYLGRGVVGISVQSLQNPHTRRALKLDDVDPDVGVRICKVHRLCAADGILQTGDCLLVRFILPQWSDWGHQSLTFF